MNRRIFAMTRDRILTEKIIRACWHEWPDKGSAAWRFSISNCKKCETPIGATIHIDFSTWVGFAELWDQLRQRKYWGEFWKWLTQRYSWEEWESKNPSQRADAVFEFWKEKGELLDKGKV